MAEKNTLVDIFIKQINTEINKKNMDKVNGMVVSYMHKPIYDGDNIVDLVINFKSFLSSKKLEIFNPKIIQSFFKEYNSTIKSFIWGGGNNSKWFFIFQKDQIEENVGDTAYVIVNEELTELEIYKNNKLYTITEFKTK